MAEETDGIEEAFEGQLRVLVLHEPSLDAARAAAARIIASTAATLGRELHVTTTDPDGTWPLIVHPDGTILEDPGKDAIPATADPTKSSTSDKADQSTTKPVSAPSTADPAARAVRGNTTPADDEVVVTAWFGPVVTA